MVAVLILGSVLTAAYSVTGRWNEEYESVDVRRAHRVLDEWSLDHLSERTFGECQTHFGRTFGAVRVDGPARRLTREQQIEMWLGDADVWNQLHELGYG